MDRGVDVFAEVLAHPGDAIAFDDVVGIQKLLHAGDGGDVAADDDRGARREFAHHAAHLAGFVDVDDDRRDAHDVVVVGGGLAGKGLAGGGVQDRAGGRDVHLHHEDAPGTVEAAQGERALAARYLVVVQLHRVDGAAAVGIVLRVRAEDGGEQDPGLSSFRMRLNHDEETDKSNAFSSTLAGFGVAEGYQATLRQKHYKGLPKYSLSFSLRFRAWTRTILSSPGL